MRRAIPSRYSAAASSALARTFACDTAITSTGASASSATSTPPMARRIGVRKIQTTSGTARTSANARRTRPREPRGCRRSARRLRLGAELTPARGPHRKRGAAERRSGPLGVGGAQLVQELEVGRHLLQAAREEQGQHGERSIAIGRAQGDLAFPLERLAALPELVVPALERRTRDGGAGLREE